MNYGNRDEAQESTAARTAGPNDTYCLGDLVFHTPAQKALKDKGVSEIFCLKAQE